MNENGEIFVAAKINNISKVKIVMEMITRVFVRKVAFVFIFGVYLSACFRFETRASRHRNIIEQTVIIFSYNLNCGVPNEVLHGK